MQSVQLIFSFFGFWGEGERDNFFLFSIGGGGPVIHPWNGRDNHVAVVARSDRPQVIPSSVIFYFIFLRFFVCSHSGDLP